MRLKSLLIDRALIIAYYDAHEFLNFYS